MLPVNAHGTMILQFFLWYCLDLDVCRFCAPLTCVLLHLVSLCLRYAPTTPEIVVLCSYKKIVWVTILNLTYPDRTETQVRTNFLQLENIHMIITRISFLTWFRMPNTWASRTMGMGASEHDQWRASQSAAPGPIAWLYSLKDFHASVVQTSSIFIHLFCKRWPWSAHMTLKCPWTS